MNLAQHTTPRGYVVAKTSSAIDVDFWLATDVEDAGYCLDAPSLLPAGATRSVNSDLYAAAYAVRDR